MKIGFDAKRIFRNRTGLGNYSRDLVRGLSSFYPDLELHLYHPHKDPRDFRLFTQKPFHFHSPKGQFGKYWRSKTIVKDLVRDQLDIYHGLSHELPYGIQKSGVRSVVSIHDLIIKKIPETFNRIDRSIYHHKMKHALKHADRVVAISKSTRRDILDIYEVEAEKIVVVPPSINQRFSQEFSEVELAEGRERLNLPKNFFLYVGSVIERKNLLNIVKAYTDLSPEDRLPFIVLGKGNKYVNEVKKIIAQNQLGSYFDFRENIRDNDDLKMHVQLARALVYPSLYEGFGMPCVEALLLKTPVISSTVSSLPEAAGPDSWLVDPKEPTAIAGAMEDILHSSENLDERLERSRIYAEQFSVENNSRKLVELYQGMI